MAPRPPASQWSSSARSSPHSASNLPRAFKVASTDGLHSLTAVKLGVSARVSMVSTVMVTPVRLGMLYRMMGRSVAQAICR
ncbi:hypothetical protein G6F65_021693 [Rhizopus arrhizus]|uniref:Uncharacterized protein n=1 Tax=Rhizopus delemar TaxID=936053 RepID=A0A9P6XN33_9FUNG|nr:hypothetical protein G6F65_021693 [Rhizopus arrhizus]KAG1526900.1 hypothetical protein G6F50_018352 [Rhizopus delemar]